MYQVRKVSPTVSSGFQHILSLDPYPFRRRTMLPPRSSRLGTYSSITLVMILLVRLYASRRAPSESSVPPWAAVDLTSYILATFFCCSSRATGSFEKAAMLEEMRNRNSPWRART